MASQVRSVYLALHYFGRTCRGGLLYEVKIGKNGKIFRKSTEDEPDCSAMKLFDENDIPEVPFVRCVSHASKLYLFVGQQYKEYEAGAKVAYILDPKTIFDANTKSLNSFDPPKACRTSPKFMSAHGMLYHLATPLIAEPEAPMPFEIYDPTTKSWDSLTPLPRCPVKIPNVHARRELIGYAVFDNCILLMLWYPGLKFVPVVFNAEWRTWHQVNLEGVGLDLLPFRGKAIVVGDTIYALSFKHGKVISFSIKISGLEEDGTSIYSLTTPYQLEGLKKNFTPKFKFLVMQTEYMAPFGDLEFCLVRSMRHNINTFQPLWITTFKIIEEEGKKSRIETLDRTVQFVSTEGYGHFWIKFCFTPDYEPKEAMLNTKKEDIQKERNRIKGSSREVDCFIPDMKPKEASLTNRKEDGQKETSWIKNSYCKVECSTP